MARTKKEHEQDPKKALDELLAAMAKTIQIWYPIPEPALTPEQIKHYYYTVAVSLAKDLRAMAREAARIAEL